MMLAIILSNAAPVALAEESGRHTHHIGIAGGATFHGSESAAYLGFDYVYTFNNGLSAAVFIEQVRGDFDLAAYGLSFGKFFDNGWKVATGPGIETKLKDGRNLFLWHFTAGYDWRFDHWSVGPVASFDFIEDASNTSYVGISVGYAF
jgi:hypothetical protein